MQSKEEYEQQLDKWISGEVPNSIIDTSYQQFRKLNPAATKEHYKTAVLATLFKDSEDG